MTLDEVFLKRKSVRKYSQKPISDEVLLKILEAGRLAPSAKNIQNWHFTALRNPAQIQALQEAAYGQKQVGGAPVCLVLWAENDRMMDCGQSAATADCSIALTYMMLKAAELDVGSCWLGHFKAPEVKKILQLPEAAVVVAVTPLGYTDEWPKGPARKTLEEIIEIRE